MPLGRLLPSLTLRTIPSGRAAAIVCALFYVALSAASAFGQGASGVRLSAPPRTIRTAVAAPIPTTTTTPGTWSTVPSPTATAPSAASPTNARPAESRPLTAAPIASGIPADATPKAVWPYSAEAYRNRAAAAPRPVFAPAASSRVRQTPTDPFPAGSSIKSETVPSAQGSFVPGPFVQGRAPVMLDEGDIYIQAPRDDYFGDSRFPYDPEVMLDWTPQFLPAGLIYRSYLAGVKESRMASVFDHDYKNGWMWDITLGARVGLFRFGSTNPIRPEGFQIDVEGSAQPRLSLEDNEDLQAVDFRAGLPITYGIGRWSTKLAMYHLSAHAGDEYMTANPTFQRINYVRDEIVLGQSYYITDDLRLYGEAGWAFNSDIAKPWEFQFGADYSPLAPSKRGSPFAAINGYIRQEQNFSGNLVVQAGWQWRPWNEGKLLRVGVQYYNGKSNQFEFYDRFENKVGVGIWYDF
jgi:hypothetical protein